MKKSAIAILMLLSCCGSAIASNPANVPVVATIAAMQALGAASPQYPNVEVLGLSSAGDNGGGFFSWISGSLPCDAVLGGGDKGTTFCATTPAGGYITSGYWQRQKFYGNDLHTAWFQGSDIGVKINNAYAALPASGGTIHVDVPNGGGCLNYSTPIVMTTLGKYPRLVSGANGGSTTAEGFCLNYTPTSGEAIKLDYADKSLGLVPPGPAIVKMTLMNNNCVTSGGCGSSAVGILIGTVNAGDYNQEYDTDAIFGFAVGYEDLNQGSPNQEFINCTFEANAVALESSDDPTLIIGGIYAGNGKVFAEQNVTPVPEIYFTNATIFSNTNNPVFDFTGGPGGTATLILTADHFEGGNPADNCEYIQGDVNVTLLGGLMECQQSTGTGSWYVSLTGEDSFSLYGTAIGANRTTNEFLYMNQSGEPSRAFLFPVLLNTYFTNLVGGTYAANATVMPIGLPNNAQVAQQIEGPMNFENYIRPGTTVVGSLPSCGSGNKGETFTVTDASSPTWGSTLTGGSSTVTLGMCNGSNWVAQ